MRMHGAKRNQVFIGEASARGGKPSKEADDNAAEVKPWRGRGGRRPPPAVRRGVRVNKNLFTTISKGDCNDEGSSYDEN